MEYSFFKFRWQCDILNLAKKRRYYIIGTMEKPLNNSILSLVNVTVYSDNLKAFMNCLQRSTEDELLGGDFDVFCGYVKEIDEDNYKGKLYIIGYWRLKQLLNLRVRLFSMRRDSFVEKAVMAWCLKEMIVITFYIFTKYC